MTVCACKVCSALAQINNSCFSIHFVLSKVKKITVPVSYVETVQLASIMALLAVMGVRGSFEEV